MKAQVANEQDHQKKKADEQQPEQDEVSSWRPARLIHDGHQAEVSPQVSWRSAMLIRLIHGGIIAHTAAAINAMKRIAQPLA
jgi:hypothetical protein